MDRKPILSIICTSYNHEKYIAQALEGFVMQQTNFPFEIIVHDDASTDKTVEIIKKYELKYPHLFVAIYQTENQYSNKDINIWADITFPKARGKYIAICEGDDYWTDPLKLQKQVNFLEVNGDFGLVHTNYIRYINDLNYFEGNPPTKISSGNIFKELIKENQIATLTVMMRRDLALEAIKSGIYEKDFLIGDYPLWLEISTKSKIGYLKDVTAVYRVLSESLSNTKDINKQVLLNRSVISVKRFYAKKNQIENEIIDEEIKFNRELISIGFIYQRPDYAKEGFIGLKNIVEYKIRFHDFLLFVGAYNFFVNWILKTIITIRKATK